MFCSFCFDGIRSEVWNAPVFGSHGTWRFVIGLRGKERASDRVCKCGDVDLMEGPDRVGVDLWCVGQLLIYLSGSLQEGTSRWRFGEQFTAVFRIIPKETPRSCTGNQFVEVESV